VVGGRKEGWAGGGGGDVIKGGEEGSRGGGGVGEKGEKQGRGI